MNNNQKIAIGVVVAALLGLVVYSTFNLAQYEVEVCVTYKGASECRIAAGATREEALRTATDNACAFLSSGRTDSMACSRTEPDSVRWNKE